MGYSFVFGSGCKAIQKAIQILPFPAKRACESPRTAPPSFLHHLTTFGVDCGMEHVRGPFAELMSTTMELMDD